LFRFIEAFAVEIAHADAVAFAGGVLVPAGHVAAFGEIGNVRGHVPGAHEPRQVDIRRLHRCLQAHRSGLALAGTGGHRGNQGARQDGAKTAQRWGHAGLLGDGSSQTAAATAGDTNIAYRHEGENL
jgi:hypothetical protein